MPLLTPLVVDWDSDWPTLRPWDMPQLSPALEDALLLLVVPTLWPTLLDVPTLLPQPTLELEPIFWDDETPLPSDWDSVVLWEIDWD